MVILIFWVCLMPLRRAIRRYLAEYVFKHHWDFPLLWETLICKMRRKWFSRDEPTENFTERPAF